MWIASSPPKLEEEIVKAIEKFLTLYIIDPARLGAFATIKIEREKWMKNGMNIVNSLHQFFTDDEEF